MKQPVADMVNVVSNNDTINYEAAVLPVFQKNCSPCHFPGGKMYDKLPFDKGETIIQHSTAIIKRIKNETDAAIIKQFVQQHE